MRRRPGKRPVSPAARFAIPAWLRPSCVVLSCLILTAVFSKEIANSDFWWQLRTGQYVWQTQSLPDPDPFAYTTAMAGHAYAGEEMTRHFNLTHEWLAQVLLYLTWRSTGFAGIVLGRAGLLVAFCALAGLVAYRRCGGFYRSLAAAFAAAAVADPLVADRPFLITFVLLAATVTILEWRKPALLWLLPFLMAIWANCHGGFVLGWVVMGAYSAESIFLRLRGRPQPGDARLWIVCSVSALAAGLNPNGFHIVPVLLNYHRSVLTSNLLEWGPPSLWPPTAFSLLLVAAAVTLLWAHRGVRVVDWLLFLAFAVAALSAGRNTILIGLLAPVLMATYLPWKRTIHGYAEMGVAALLLTGLGIVFSGGQSFQLHAAEWAYPKGAADFLLSHHITERMFNTYEYGGYLTWRLWPRERVFIDGRALSESVFKDYRRILFDADDRDGKSAAQLLDRYGVQVAVMNTFEYTSGQAYLVAGALADPDNMGWNLVYADPQAIVFLRHPPEGMRILDSSEVLTAMESECDLHIQHEPQFPGCARNLGQILSNTGDFANARRWLGIYLEHAPGRDPEAENAFRKMVEAGK
jgi:hypothetical protein